VFVFTFVAYKSTLKRCLKALERSLLIAEISNFEFAACWALN